MISLSCRGGGWKLARLEQGSPTSLYRLATIAARREGLAELVVRLLRELVDEVGRLLELAYRLALIAPRKAGCVCL